MTNREAIEIIKSAQAQVEWSYPMDYAVAFDMAISALQGQVNNECGAVAGVQTNVSDALYEYHYDHTDCIWYRPEARNRCPSTCAQYRDGWNDAMNYIFRDGKGYRPYRRNEQYGE